MTKLPALTKELTTFATGDLVYGVDISDTTDDPTGSSFKSQYTNLQNEILKGLAVTPEMFGAAADGVTDDSTEIQAAVDNGKIVYLTSDKTYLIDTQINLATGSDFRGNGGTILKGSALATVFSVASKNNVSIRDVVFSSVVFHGGTAQAGTPSATEITLATAASASNDVYNDMVVKIISGKGVGQLPRNITDYDGPNRIADISPNWDTTPDATSVYEIWAQGDITITSTISRAITIDNCIFDGAAIAIRASTLTQSVISNNRFYNFTNNQVLLRSACVGNIIANNECLDNGAHRVAKHCLQIEALTGEVASTGNTIKGNNVQSGGNCCMLSGPQVFNNMVTGNCFVNTSGDNVSGNGMKCDGSGLNTISGNIITGPANGIVEAAGNLIIGNVIRGKTGVDLVDVGAGGGTADPSTVTGNVIQASEISSIEDSGMAQAGVPNVNEIQLATTASAIDNAYNNQRVKTIAGTGLGQIRWIVDYTGSTRTCLISPNWTVTPDATTDYEIWNTTDGISATTPGHTLTGNVIEDFNGTGITATNAAATGLTVKDNHIIRPGRYGFRFDSDDHFVSCNVVRNAIGPQYGAIVAGDNGFYLDNEFFNNTFNFLRFDGSVTGNFIRSRLQSQVDNTPTGNTWHIITPLEATVTWDPGSISDGDGETKSVSVTDAVFGDFVTVSATIDLEDLQASAYVSAADTVEIRLDNNTGGAVDLVSATWAVRVMRQSVL